MTDNHTDSAAPDDLRTKMDVPWEAGDHRIYAQLDAGRLRIIFAEDAGMATYICGLHNADLQRRTAGPVPVSYTDPERGTPVTAVLPPLLLNLLIPFANDAAAPEPALANGNAAAGGSPAAGSPPVAPAFRPPAAAEAPASSPATTPPAAAAADREATHRFNHVRRGRRVRGCEYCDAAPPGTPSGEPPAAAGGAGRTADSEKRTVTNADIRAWAKRRGRKVAERGRIPQAVVDDYVKAHS